MPRGISFAAVSDHCFRGTVESERSIEFFQQDHRRWPTFSTAMQKSDAELTA
jgi:hypothetical protein